MALTIETYSNVEGGNSFYKAISPPHTAQKMSNLIRRLKEASSVAIYDPLNLYSGFAEFYNLSEINITESFVRDTKKIGSYLAGCRAKPITDFSQSSPNTLFISTFDSNKFKEQIKHLIASNLEIVSLDDCRLEDSLLTNKSRYLDNQNFATNFAFFRDEGGARTRLSTANYWSGYGAKKVEMNLTLFGEDGSVLADWRQPLNDGDTGVIIDSREIRNKFSLSDFIGQLFIHVNGIAGHDIVKYALDTWDSSVPELSCTHDANAWPSDLYAGLPAPQEGEQVCLWVQNSHPNPIPPGQIGINLMGDDKIIRVNKSIPGFGTEKLIVNDLLPEARWPQQIEIHAGKYFVRPRYEITSPQNTRRIAHVNVERDDLKVDPEIPRIGQQMGKGYILPAPILPIKSWTSALLPSPMATCQNKLSIAALIYDASGQEIFRYSFGKLNRNHQTVLEINDCIKSEGLLLLDYGHVELTYDFTNEGDTDGWLHGIFRYKNLKSNHVADTSFGAHIYNTLLTYRNEPQSYNGPPPGLSTRLFLRLGHSPHDTICHLIYPASTPWHSRSETILTLVAPNGSKIAREKIQIPCGGSIYLQYHRLFTSEQREKAGDGAYIIVRDSTCRLFGYHGLLAENGAFSLDHMFGF